VGRRRSLIPAGFHVFYTHEGGNMQTLANVFSGNKSYVYMSASGFATPLQVLINLKKLREFITDERI
jgi:hypothetical protein